MNQSYSLFELNTYIKQVLNANFAQQMWIRCEIASVKMSRGHYYIDLVDKKEKELEITAQASAVIWANDYSKLLSKYGTGVEALLRSGIQVLMAVEVQFHERFGLKLIIKDLDPRFTEGVLAQQKRDILARLQTEGLLQNNKSKLLPPVIQRIAVVTSKTAAGYQDFERQLIDNHRNYSFELVFFEASMQGDQAARSIASQIEQISRQSKFDCIALTRGGGSKLDLLAFDQYELAYAIAMSSIPVLTGIGHDYDESMADLVAKMALKTPTALAQFIIQHNSEFEDKLIDNYQFIAEIVLSTVAKEENKMDVRSKSISLYCRIFASKALEFEKNKSKELTQTVSRTLERQSHKLSQNNLQLIQMLERLQHGERQLQHQLRNEMKLQLRVATNKFVQLLPFQRKMLIQELQSNCQNSTRNIEHKQLLIEALDPSSILKKGYSIATLNQQKIQDASLLRSGDLIKTYLAKGSFTSEVKQINDEK